MSDYMYEQYEESFKNIKNNSFWYDDSNETTFTLITRKERLEDLLEKIDLLKNYLIDFKIIDFISYKYFNQNMTSNELIKQNKIIIDIQTEIMKESKELNFNLDICNLSYFEVILQEILKIRKLINSLNKVS